MTDLFSRANSIGLSCIREWLPDGRQDGHEWIARNPTRHDEHIGSFRINIDTGVWSDFATSDAGSDPVSLYAYLNQFECESRADEKNYKNREGGIQAEAARAILEKYDAGYFPDDKDDFTPPKKKKSKDDGSYWEGWHILESGMENPPDFDPSYFITLWGPLVDKWFFENEHGRIVMCVARFKKEGERKNDKPFTLWRKGSGTTQETKWRSKALDGKYPLWGLRSILQNQTLPVLLCEGQKAAARAATVLSEKYCCVGWYGGAGNIEKTDLAPLTGRVIYFWHDDDQAGRKVIPILNKLNCNTNTIYPPPGVKQGWDIADAIDENWSVDKLVELIEKKKETIKDTFLDDNGTLPLKVLGFNGGNIWLYGRSAERAVSCAAKSLNKQFLYTVAPKNSWAEFYAWEGKISWDNAIDDLLRKAERLQEFDENRIRRCGAWWDSGEIVVHTGSKLIYKGKELSLGDMDSDYVYERSRNVPYRSNGELDSIESSELYNVMKLIPFEKEIYRLILAGWITLGPWSGILKWRPHVWITGKKGSGKTWIIGNVIQRMVKDWSISGSGSSTPAGLRQAMKNCALDIIMDEAEGDNWKQSENIEQILKILREVSSGMTAANLSTLQGTSDGEGRQWQLYSMALLGSIGAALVHGADADRFTRINLKPDGDDDRFQRLIKSVELFTPLWVESFHARTYKVMHELIECIEVMTKQITTESKSSRIGDQLGTLLAGAWMVNHDKSACASEAKDWLDKIKLYDILEEREETEDEGEIINEILASKVMVQKEYVKVTITIGRALQEWYKLNNVTWINMQDVPDIQGVTKEAIKESLEQSGIKPTSYNGEWVCIAKNHPAIKKMLADTPYRSIYFQLLKRSPLVDPKECSGNFSGMQLKYIRLKAQEMLEDIPI